MPIQIIQTRLLSEEDNIWLKNLSNKLDASSFSQIVQLCDGFGEEIHKQAYLDVLMDANPQFAKDVLNNMGVVLNELVVESGLKDKYITESRLESAVNVIMEFGTTLAKATQVTRLPETEKDTLINELKSRNIKYEI
ncbi:hypothetical protein AGMMS49975_20290 [Clostridia bacterium]|nr:hypothetical protein AGMMS49975_20290 [Clostridia bacterium]